MPAWGLREDKLTLSTFGSCLMQKQEMSWKVMHILVRTGQWTWRASGASVKLSPGFWSLLPPPTPPDGPPVAEGFLYMESSFQSLTERLAPQGLRPGLVTAQPLPEHSAWQAVNFERYLWDE